MEDQPKINLETRYSYKLNRVLGTIFFGSLLFWGMVIVMAVQGNSRFDIHSDMIEILDKRLQLIEDQQKRIVELERRVEQSKKTVSNSKSRNPRYRNVVRKLHTGDFRKDEAAQDKINAAEYVKAMFLDE